MSPQDEQSVRGLPARASHRWDTGRITDTNWHLRQTTIVFITVVLSEQSLHQKRDSREDIPTSPLCCSVAQLCPTVPPHGLQHTQLPRPSPSPGACSNSCPLSQFCHPTISSSVIPFSSCPQSFPASGSFLERYLHGRELKPPAKNHVSEPP